MQEIEGYEHITGFHCGTTSIKSILAFYGYDVSERMVLGLGQGLFISYMKGASLSPTRLTFTRTPDLEMRAFERLGVDAKLRQTSNQTKAWNWLKGAIDENKLVMLQVDLKYLPYYQTNTSFAGHKILVTGYDETSKTIQISDNEFNDIQLVGYDDLKKARHPLNTIFDVRNNWFDIKVLDELTPFEVSIPIAVRGQANILLSGPDYFGISAIDCMAREIMDWEKADDWKWCARFSYQVIEKRGTGGGGFRKQYAEFLREAAPFFSVIKKDGLVDLMEEDAKAWTDLALTFKDISEGSAVFADTIPFFKNISKLENQFCQTVSGANR